MKRVRLSRTENENKQAKNMVGNEEEEEEEENSYSDQTI